MATKSSIWVGEDAYKHLLTISMGQRLHETPSKETLDKKWKAKLSVLGKDDMVQLTDDSLGGVDANGRWCSWTLKDMKFMLLSAGLSWNDGEKVNYVSL